MSDTPSIAEALTVHVLDAALVAYRNAPPDGHTPYERMRAALTPVVEQLVANARAQTIRVVEASHEAVILDLNARAEQAEADEQAALGTVKLLHDTIARLKRATSEVCHRVAQAVGLQGKAHSWADIRHKAKANRRGLLKLRRALTDSNARAEQAEARVREIRSELIKWQNLGPCNALLDQIDKWLSAATPGETPRVAHSKSEYKRLKAMGANVLPPGEE